MGSGTRFSIQSKPLGTNLNQSAGAGGVETHVLFPPSTPLFRAGILDSSTGPL